MPSRPTYAADPNPLSEASRDESSSELIDAVLEATQQAAPRIDGVVVGKLVSCDGSGGALVDHSMNDGDGPVRARVATTLGADDAGVAVALLFEAGDPRRPIVIGKMAVPTTPHAALPPVEARVDGRHVTIEADETLELRCGQASIVLTRAGKLLLRGEYILTRAAGTHRIQGGTVEIN